MTIWRLILREIACRKANFLLSALAVLVAVGSVVAAVSLLDRYAIRGEQRAEVQKAELEKKMAILEDDYRKISLDLNFNLMILPKAQNMADFYAEDFAAKVMPEAYAQKLAEARIATINHIVPVLEQRISWPERKRTIQLVGASGAMVLKGKGTKSALQQPIAAGHVVVGYELHRSLDLAAGQALTFCGQRLVISALEPQRGNQDDITLWINLPEAQKLLDKPGRINAILAIECNCAADLLGTIRAEVARVLPDTQVVEFASKALARAEARDRATAAASESTEREARNRAAAVRQRERLFAVLAPLVTGACAVWAGLLALGNVRSRSGEIGILRALGVPTRRILAILLIRAALIGLVGAAIGFGAGWLGSWLGENRISGGPPLEALFDPRLFALVLVLTPILSALVSWLPAAWAAQLDPADCLRAGGAS